MNTKKNQLGVVFVLGELAHQEYLDNTSVSYSVKDSKMLQKKLFYVAPTMMLFSASDVILNQIGNNSDGLAAQAQS